jgi:hypothetical protein
MQETRRFAIALAGIGGCLGIAAGIVVTGLTDVPVVPAPNLPTARAAQSLPRFPMPSWSDVTSDVATARTTRRAAPTATSGSEVATAAGPSTSAPVNPPLDPFDTLKVDGERGRTVETLGAPRVARGAQSSVDPQSSIVNRQSSVAKPLDARPVPLMLSGAPRAAGADLVVAESRARERDAVTGAFVTAGSHVGKSFRTVGRTLKRVF